LIFLFACIGTIQAMPAKAPVVSDSVDIEQPDSVLSYPPIDLTTVLHPDSAYIPVENILDQASLFPDEVVPPYLHTDLCIRSYGDYLSHQTGVYSLQHGSFFQGEVVTKSALLPGLSCEYNSIPFFHQGSFVPFRSGLDLNVLMYEDVGLIEITPLHYISLISEGEVLSLRSLTMPDNENPSSVSIARGPYGYDRAGWRFARRFTENAAFVFSAGFREATGLYSEGADYDDFNVNGLFTYRIKPDLEFQYRFYQHKAQQGVLQFDRIFTPLLRNNHDQSLHNLKMTHVKSDELSIGFSLYHQKNYSRLFDNEQETEQFIRDFIWGGQGEITFKKDNHNFNLSLGGNRHYFSSKNYSVGRLVVMGFTLSDSLILNSKLAIESTLRARHNNIDDFTFSGSIVADYYYSETGLVQAFAGALSSLPDIYSRSYAHPDWISGEDTTTISYSYQPSPELKSTENRFVGAALNWRFYDNLQSGAKLTYEDVSNDRTSFVTQDGNEFKSTQKNIDYSRISLSGWFDYAITKHYRGSAGLTYFNYSPSEIIENVKFTPVLMVNTSGMIKFEEVLRTIDLAGSFEARYYSERNYHGLFTDSGDADLLKPVIVLDAALIIIVGSFEFRLCEDNILDFLLKNGNDYSLWGQYQMPPGNVWWQFTWNFKN